ncbi:MAG: TenA family protein [Actinomycetales bacterium]
MTTYTGDLRHRYDSLFEDFWQHPFLTELRAGTLGYAPTAFYVGQDHQYLTAYLRCYGLGLAMSPDREWMRHFIDAGTFLLDDETHPHHVMCRVHGIDYGLAGHERLAPSAQAYIDHLTACGRDSLGVLMYALLPCPWTYGWAARRYLAETDPAEVAANPFRGWWEFYAGSAAQERLADTLGRCDDLARRAGQDERRRMERAFELSCRYEIRFWEMAWTQESWDLAGQPVG